jgi:hypothetical protein
VDFGRSQTADLEASWGAIGVNSSDSAANATLSQRGGMVLGVGGVVLIFLDKSNPLDYIIEL